MAFWEKVQETAKVIGEKTSVAMKAAGDKASDAVEITKQKAKISSEKTAIADIKKQIGELVWTKYEAGETISAEDVAEQCASIQTHLDTIAACEAAIEEVKKNGKASDEEPVEEASGETEADAEQETAPTDVPETEAEEAVEETPGE